MSAAQLELEAEEAKTVFCWRFDELVRAGYEAGDAVVLASCTGVDLHAAVDLLRRGCPAQLALRILV